MSDHQCNINLLPDVVEEILREHTGVSNLSIVIDSPDSWHAEGTVPIASLAPKAPRKRRSKKESS